MRIRVEDMPEDGLVVEIDQADGWAVAAVSRALEGDISDLQAELELTRIAELLRVSGTASATAQRRCDRCGGDIRIHLSGAVELLFEPQRLPALAEEHITDPAELDLGFFDGEALDLSDVLMEQFALWLPDRVRCGDRDVTQVGDPWTCTLPAQDPGPALDRQNPFAKLRLPE